MSSQGRELTFGDEQMVNAGLGDGTRGKGTPGGAAMGPLYPSIQPVPPGQPLYPTVAPANGASTGAPLRGGGRPEGEGMRSWRKGTGSWDERSDGEQSRIGISVTAPLKNTGPSIVPGVNESYYTYLVNSHMSYCQAEKSVRRRFRDFVDFANLLRAKFRGIFIPQRPHRNVFQGKIRMSPSFIEERRACLEKYLRQLAEHPKISGSEELRTFLEAEGQLRECAGWIQLHPVQPTWLEGAKRLLLQMTGQDWVPTPTEVTQQPSAKRHVVRALRESFKSIKERRQPTMEYTPHEAKLRRETEAMDSFQHTVKHAEKWATVWKERFQSVGRALNDFGEELNALANFEMDSGYVRIPATATVGRGCRDASKLHQQFASQTATPLLHIHEYKERMGNVLRAFNSREQALMTLHTLDIDINSKKELLKEMEVTAGKANKVLNLEHDLRALHASKVAAQAAYDELAANNEEELARFNEQRSKDWADMLRGFATTQADYAAHLAESWCQVAEGLGVDSKVIQALQKP